jgi:hypothetical protein
VARSFPFLRLFFTFIDIFGGLRTRGRGLLRDAVSGYRGATPAYSVSRHLGRCQDLALTQAVAVTRNGRERTVLISVDEYRPLKRRDRQVLGLDDFTDADLAALLATRAPDELTSSPSGYAAWRSWSTLVR